jgi:hypothetical protein
MLCVGTVLRTLRVLSRVAFQPQFAERESRDAERPKSHYDAEHRNERKCNLTGGIGFVVYEGKAYLVNGVLDK